MSNIRRPSIVLTCNAPAGTIARYLWFVETSLAGLVLKAANVDAQIAAGEQVTGYLAASVDPTLQLAPGPAGGLFFPWNFPQPVYAFVVAQSPDDEIYTRALDTVSKFVGDGT